ncbi:MAG: branched chain amino acid aminotransferase, partial [Chloroflexi bacterium]|nr:branched chain amino acid aminotransferase [Chloroflexota bacterium]
AKTEAEPAGFDEAIMLNEDGHVSEGSGENIFIVNDGVIYTPPSSDNILVGITRNTVVELAEQELGIPTVERTLDRSELWLADEVFMTGTAAHVTPISSVDRRVINGGETGPITAQLERLYFDAIIGNRDAYAQWLTPIYTDSYTND